ncbi:MAG: transposase, partial [Thermoguttaceae bacterium]
RNAELRRLIGIESEGQVPKKWNISRFLIVLGQEPHRGEMRKIFDFMVRNLGRVVLDLGQNTAGDSTSLNGRAKANAAEVQAEAAEGLPQPSGGRKEYTDDTGKVVKVVEWFGYKLHLLVDVKHEVILAYWITSTKEGDGETLPILLEQAQANLPAGRIKTLAYDKAADDNHVHRVLSKAGKGRQGADAARARRPLQHRL